MQKEMPDIIEVQNGVILPAKYMSLVFPCGLGGVINEKGEFIEESGTEFPEIFGGAYAYNILEENSLEEEVIYIGHLRTHWGHFLIDCTMRMWYLAEKNVPCRIAYCGTMFDENTLPENILAFFNLFGIKHNQLLDIKVPTRVSRILIPRVSLGPENLYTYKFKDMFRSVSGKIDVDLYETSEKLYYTRTGLVNENEIGEKLIEEIFRKNGYRIISPERESLERQIALMKSCRIFASIEGTVAHNIVFAGEQTKQIILRKHTYINVRQPRLNKCMDVKADYINVGCRPFGKCFPPDYYGGIFWLRATKELRSYCRENNMWFPTRREILLADIKNVVKYLHRCGKHLRECLETRYQTDREDRAILGRVYLYKNIVIYGMNARALRWERKIRKKRRTSRIFMTDSNWRRIQKYREMYDWESLITLGSCCFLISISNAEASAEVKGILVRRGINEKDIYCYAGS